MWSHHPSDFIFAIVSRSPLQPDSTSLEREMKQQPLFRGTSPRHILFLRAPPLVLRDSLSSLCLLQKAIYLIILPQGRCFKVSATSARALPCLKGAGGGGARGAGGHHLFCKEASELKKRAGKLQDI